MSKLANDVPDGGWGWVIVFVCFFLHLLIGFMYAVQSILYLALQDYFGEGKGPTSWILSAYSTMLVLSGPVSAFFSIKYSYRAVAFVGGLLMGFGAFISFFANSVIFLVVSIGLVSGTGAGLVYVPVVAMSAIYFDKKRSLAVGLGTCGLGVGTLALPPLVTMIENKYTWRGLVLIASGCLFNMCVVALLLRPLTVTNTVSKVDERDTDGNSQRSSNDCMDVDVSVVEELDASDNHSLLGVVGCDNNEFEVQSLSRLTSEVLPSPVGTHNDGRSSYRCDTQLNAATEIVKRNKTIFTGPQRRRLENCNPQKSMSSENVSRRPPHFSFSSARELSKTHHSNVNVANDNKSDKEGLTNLSIMLMGSTYNIAGLEPKLNSMLSLRSKTSIFEKKSEFDDLQTRNGEQHSSTCFSGVGHILKVYIDLIRNWKCALLMLSNCLVHLTYTAPIIYLVDRAVVENGIERDSAMLALSFFGAGNISGRLCTGFLGDLPCVNRIVLYFICIFLWGLITCLSVFCGPHVPLHVAYGFATGLLVGGYVILTPLVLVDVLGVEVVGQAFGLCLLSMAGSTILGTPLAGWIFDLIGSYTIPFIVYGLCLILSSLLLVPLIYTSLRGDNPHEQNSQEERVPLESPP